MKEPINCHHADKRLERGRLEAVIQVRGTGDLEQGRRK